MVYPGSNRIIIEMLGDAGLYITTLQVSHRELIVLPPPPPSPLSLCVCVCVRVPNVVRLLSHQSFCF